MARAARPKGTTPLLRPSQRQPAPRQKKVRFLLGIFAFVVRHRLLWVTASVCPAWPVGAGFHAPFNSGSCKLADRHRTYRRCTDCSMTIQLSRTLAYLSDLFLSLGAVNTESNKALHAQQGRQPARERPGRAKGRAATAAAGAGARAAAAAAAAAPRKAKPQVPPPFP